MRKAFYGPYYRFIIRTIHGKKIIGVADKDEKQVFSRKISRIISKVDKTRTTDEIYEKIHKKLKLIYTEQLPIFSGAARSIWS